MKERPIIFSGEMVRAVLDGRKTQTRRVVKFRHHTAKLLGQQFEHTQLKAAYPARVNGWVFWSNSFTDAEKITTQQYEHGLPCPYGVSGDRLWVKENFYVQPWIWEWDHKLQPVHYAASSPKEQVEDYILKPSIFMPRWASRIMLEINGVRVERLQNMSLEDCTAEGVAQYTFAKGVLSDNPPDPRWKFIELWNRINAKSGWSWESNPWVWAIKFRMLESAEDDPSLSFGTSALNPIGQ